LEAPNTLLPVLIGSWLAVTELYQTASGIVFVSFPNNPASGSRFFGLHNS